jgi:glycosyltransferase involved in cell wall biosynthesis/phosphatidylserine synthase
VAGDGRVDLAVFAFPYASPVIGEHVRGLRTTLAQAGVAAEFVAPPPWATPGHALRVRMPALGSGSGRAWRSAAWLVTYLAAQLELAWHAVRLRRRASAALLFIGPHFAGPLLVARLTRWRIVYVPAGQAGTRESRRPVRAAILASMQRAMLRRCDLVALEGEAELPLLPPGLPAAALALRAIAIPDAVAPLRGREGGVLLLGRLEECKGIRAVLEILPLLDVHVDVIGEGTLRPAVEEEASRHAHLRFHGWVDEEEKRRLLGRARLVVLPSRGEGVPTAMLEAMAHGAPVLATAVGGVADFIEDGKTGFLLADAGPEAVLHGIRRALAWPRLEEVAAAAREQVARRCSQDAAKERWQAVARVARGPAVQRPVRRFAWADAVTLGNALAGTLSLGWVLAGPGAGVPPAALALFALALVCDGLDGWVARRWGGSRWGAHLDSAADAITYGLLPWAALAVTYGAVGSWLGAAACLVAWWRLATRAGPAAVFLGLPASVPAAALMVMAARSAPWPLTACATLGLSALSLSRLRYPAARGHRFPWLWVLAAAALGAGAAWLLWPHLRAGVAAVALACLVTLVLVAPLLVRKGHDPQLARRAHRPGPQRPGQRGKLAPRQPARGKSDPHARRQGRVRPTPEPHPLHGAPHAWTPREPKDLGPRREAREEVLVQGDEQAPAPAVRTHPARPHLDHRTARMQEEERL